MASFKEQSDMKGLFDFTYELVAGGKATGNISFGEQSVPFTVNNSSNPLFDLLKGMSSLIFEPSHIWGEDNISWIDWYEEVGALKWILSTEDGVNILVKIVKYDDIFDESSANLIIDMQYDMQDFFYAIINKLDIFIKKVGLLNYEQQWQKDEFPLTYFLLLKKYLIEKGNWIPTNEKLGTLSDEIDFLLA